MCSFVFESSLGTRAALLSTAMSQVYHRLLHCSLSQLLWKQMSTLLCNYGTAKSAKRKLAAQMWRQSCPRIVSCFELEGRGLTCCAPLCGNTSPATDMHMATLSAKEFAHHKN